MRGVALRPVIGEPPSGVHRGARHGKFPEHQAKADGVLGWRTGMLIVPRPASVLLEAKAGVKRARRAIAFGHLQIEAFRAALAGGPAQPLDQPPADAEALALAGDAEGEYFCFIGCHAADDEAPEHLRLVGHVGAGTCRKCESAGLGEQIPEACRIPRCVEQAGMQARDGARVLHAAAANAKRRQGVGLHHGSALASDAPSCARTSGGRR